MLATAPKYLPASQLTQALVPVTVEYAPAGQFVQVEDAVIEYLPTSQLIHMLATAPKYVPAGQDVPGTHT